MYIYIDIFSPLRLLISIQFKLRPFHSWSHCAWLCGRDQLSSLKLQLGPGRPAPSRAINTRLFSFKLRPFHGWSIVLGYVGVIVCELKTTAKAG